MAEEGVRAGFFACDLLVHRPDSEAGQLLCESGDGVLGFRMAGLPDGGGECVWAIDIKLSVAGFRAAKALAHPDDVRRFAQRLLSICDKFGPENDNG